MNRASRAAHVLLSHSHRFTRASLRVRLNHFVSLFELAIAALVDNSSVSLMQRDSPLLSENEGKSTLFSIVQQFSPQMWNIGTPLPAFVQLMDSESPEDRLLAIEMLGKIFAEDVAKQPGFAKRYIPTLLKVIDDTKAEWSLRTAAIRALVVLCGSENGRADFEAASPIGSIIRCLDPWPKPEATPEQTVFQLKACLLLEAASASNNYETQISLSNAISRLISVAKNTEPILSACVESTLFIIIRQFASWESRFSRDDYDVLPLFDAIPWLAAILQLEEIDLGRKIEATACLGEFVSSLVLAKDRYTIIIPELITLLRGQGETAQVSKKPVVRKKTYMLIVSRRTDTGKNHTPRTGSEEVCSSARGSRLASMVVAEW